MENATQKLDSASGGPGLDVGGGLLDATTIQLISAVKDEIGDDRDKSAFHRMQAVLDAYIDSLDWSGPDAATDAVARCWAVQEMLGFTTDIARDSTEGRRWEKGA